jgi:hypothetical protein
MKCSVTFNSFGTCEQQMTDFDDFEVTLYGKEIQLVVQNGEKAL